MPGITNPQTPYQDGVGIHIDENKEVNILIQWTDNQLWVNDNNELFVDGQLPEQFKFPFTDNDLSNVVGANVGQVLQDNGFPVSGLLALFRTVSWEVAGILFGTDGTVYHFMNGWWVS